MFHLTQTVVVEPVHKIQFEKNKRILVTYVKLQCFFYFFNHSKAAVSVEEEREVDLYDRKLTITFPVRSQEEIMEFLCLDLALTFIQRLSLRNDPEVILLSIKLFFTSVHKQGIGHENITDERIDKLLWELKRKVITDFGSQIAVYHHREQLLKELQVRYPQCKSCMELIIGI